MKIYWILLVAFVASITIANNLTRITFASCDPNEWMLTNTTITWNNETKEIKGNITYSEGIDNQIYTIHIVIDECMNQTNCLGEPRVWIDKINCDDVNLNSTYLNACKTGQEISKMEIEEIEEENWMIFQYGQEYGKELLEYSICISIDDSSYSIDNDEPNLNETEQN